MINRLEALFRSHADGYRWALARWRDAAATCREHFADGGSDDRTDDAIVWEAMDSGTDLRALVLAAHGLSDDDDLTEPVAIDLGDVLLVVGPHHDDVSTSEPQEGAILMALPRANIVRA
jgi:hypothetical protein